MPRPVAVALTGGIGAGKSEALKAFARHGAATISSDAIVHRLLREDVLVRAALLERFGDEILGGDGAVDREALARIVFGDREQLTWLEALLHPRVIREYTGWRHELAESREAPAVAVVEVPLLYETGGETRFDAVVAIGAPEEIRAARTPLSVGDRAARLLPDEEKLRRADFAYVNDGSLEGLDAFVCDVLAELERRAE